MPGMLALSHYLPDQTLQGAKVLVESVCRGVFRGRVMVFAATEATTLSTSVMRDIALANSSPDLPPSLFAGAGPSFTRKLWNKQFSVEYL